ncbi:hypothetical protein [Mesotoga sp.]|jgi:hypothetical protein
MNSRKAKSFLYLVRYVRSLSLSKSSALNVVMTSNIRDEGE